jgi:hypothetical protein
MTVEVRMRRWMSVGWLLAMVLTAAPFALAQSGDKKLATAIADLTALKKRMGSAETRTRVDALHQAWSIALSIPDADAKLLAIDLLKEPVGSSSDHIRMPAVYAIAEIANSSGDVRVKTRALGALAEPLNADQVPIRDVAIDAVNSIARSANVASAAVAALEPPTNSGNNGVRIPAINALVRAVVGRNDSAASEAAMDLLAKGPLESAAVTGGMEVRMMALAALEKIGVDATSVQSKAKAMGLLQSYASRGGWEPEAKKRAQEAADRVKATIKE